MKTFHTRGTNDAHDRIERLVGSEIQTYTAATLEEAVEQLREDVRATWGEEAAAEVASDMLEELR